MKRLPHTDAYIGNNVYSDFIFSAIVKKEGLEATAFTVEFGATEGKYSFVTFDFLDGKVLFGDQAHPEIKSADYPFLSDTEYKIDLVVNDGVAKVFVNEGGASVLLYRLPDYVSGRIGHDLEESHFVYKDESLTNLKTKSGDYFVGGYEVEKVVNLGENNLTLDHSQYRVEQGIVTIDRDYLATLEAATLYKFRAVTSYTDFDFYVETPAMGVEVTPQLKKYYRGNDVTFELSAPSSVTKAMIDGESYPFTLSENKDVLSIAASELESLPSGEHTLKLFTNAGRPEAKFSLYSTVEVFPEVIPPSNHTFFFIDIAIFAALILGYGAFSFFSKRAKKKQ